MTTDNIKLLSEQLYLADTIVQLELENSRMRKELEVCKYDCQTGEMSRSCWMIEKSINGAAHWWIESTGENGNWDDPRRWTTYASKGRKYEIESEAKYVIGGGMIECTATEHVFIGERGVSDEQP